MIDAGPFLSVWLSLDMSCFGYVMHWSFRWICVWFWYVMWTNEIGWVDWRVRLSVIILIWFVRLRIINAWCGNCTNGPKDTGVKICWRQNMLASKYAGVKRYWRQWNAIWLSDSCSGLDFHATLTHLNFCFRCLEPSGVCLSMTADWSVYLV